MSSSIFRWALLGIIVSCACLGEKDLHASLVSRFLPSPSGVDISELLHQVSQKDKPLVPVVIVPSFLGVRLDAKLENVVNHWYCYKNSDWYTIWYNELEFVPKAFNCWLSNVEMNYSPQNGSYTCPSGVTVRADDYGGVSTVAYVDQGETVGVWNTTVEVLTKMGYQVGKSLRAAPYDWRVGADAFPAQFKALQALIEDTYQMNGNQTVAVVSFSSGSPYFLLFLNTVTQKWKDTYIHSFTSFSGIFGGTSWAASAILSLEPLFSTAIGSPRAVRDMLQTWGVLEWLLPTPQVFNKSPLISTPSDDYMATNYTQMLLDYGSSQAAAVLNNTEKFRVFTNPGVRTNCIYGFNVSTLETLDFYTPSFGLYFNTTADGDGIALTASLSLCESWKSQQDSPVTTYRIPNMAHADVLQNAQALRIFVDTLLSE